MQYFVALDSGEVEELKVSSRTDTQSFTKAITESFRSNKSQEIKALGAGPINTAVKALASASGELKRGPTGLKDILVRISWFNATGKEGDNKPISGIVMEPLFIVNTNEPSPVERLRVMVEGEKEEEQEDGVERAGSDG